MEHDFDLYKIEPEKRIRPGKIRSKSMRRCMAVLLSVVLAAGTCLPAMAVEQSDTQTEEAGGAAMTDNEQAAEAQPEESGDKSAEVQPEESGDETAEVQSEEPSEAAATGSPEETASEGNDNSGEADAQTAGSADDNQEDAANDMDEAEIPEEADNADTAKTADATENAPEEEPNNVEKPENTSVRGTAADGNLRNSGETSPWLNDYDYSIAELFDMTTVVLLNSYNGADTEIEVPGTAVVDGVTYPVSALSANVWPDSVERLTFDEGFVFSESCNYFFYGKESLIAVDMSRADTSKIADMDSMFSGCSNLQEVNFGSINVDGVSNVRYMFSNCSSLEELDLECFSGSSAIREVEGMFSGCSSLRRLNLGGWDWSQVQYSWVALDGCENLEEFITPANLSGEIILPYKMVAQDGTIYTELFTLSESIMLTKLEVPQWLNDYDYELNEDTINLYYYHGSASEITVPASEVLGGKEYGIRVDSSTSWGDVTSITFEDGFVLPEYCGWLFSDKQSLVSVDISRADTSNIADMSYMFFGCSSLKSVNFGNINVASLEDASYMFSGCSSLEEADVSFLNNSSSLYSVYGMFNGCSSLNSVNMSGLDLTNISCWELFDGCDNLEEIVTPQSVPSDSEISLPCMMADQDNNLYCTMPGGNLSLHKVELPEFFDDYEYELSYGNIILSEYHGTDTEITVPGHVTVLGKDYTVGSYGCVWSDGVTSLSFEEGFFFMSGYYGGVFSQMVDLEQLDLRNAQFTDDTEIDSPFEGCGKLRTLYLPANYRFESSLPKVFRDEEGNKYSEAPTGLPNSIMLQAVPTSDWLENYVYHLTDDDEGIILGRYTGDETEIVVPGSATVDDKEYDKILIKDNPWTFVECTSLRLERGVQINPDAAYLFSSCLSIESVDFSELDGNLITEAYDMFNFCAELKTLDMSGLDFSTCSSAENMLEGCEKLETIMTPVGVNCSIELPNPFIDSEGNIYTEIPRGLDHSITLTKAEVDEWLSAYTFEISGDSIILISYKNKEFFDPETWEFNYIKKLTVPGSATIGTKVFSKIVLSSYIWSDLNIEEICFEDGVVLPEDCTNVLPSSRLEKIDLSEVDTSGTTDMHYIFKGCSRLASIVVPQNLSLDVYLPGAFADESGNMYTSLPKNLDESITINKVAQEGWLNDYSYYVTEDRIVLTGYHGEESDLVVPGNGTVGNKSYDKVELSSDINWGWQVINLAFDNGVVLPDNSRNLFSGENFESIDLTNVDSSNVTSMSEMFSWCYNLRSINWGGIDTSNVTDMSEMFSDSSSLTELDLSGFNTSNVTNMNSMFYGCNGLQTLDLNGFDTTKVTDMGHMFELCTSLGELDLSSFDTSNVTDMEEMFSYDRALTLLKISGFNTEKVTDISEMFYDCDSLTELDLSGWDLSSLEDGRYVFSGNIPVIKSPVNVPVMVKLRALYTGSDGYTYNALPMNRDKSMLLTWTSESGDPTGNISGDPVPQIRIITQPQDANGVEGEEAICTVEAEGEGLTYQWYYKNANASQFLASSQITDTYRVTLNEKTKNRKVYCVITDANGNTVTTDTVQLYVNVPFAITEQPTDTYVDALGDKAYVSVTATGDGLTYQWYYKNEGASKFLESTNTNATYTVTVNEKVKNRQVYCVITDKNGDTLTTDTVGIYVNETFEITEQPVDVYVDALGETATVSVEATGSGLTYQWYYKNAGASKFYASTNTTPTYSVTVNERSVNRQVYCEITDVHGESLTTDTVGIYVNETFEITEQPADVYVDALGETATISVEATGSGLTYQWYYKNAGASKFFASTNTTPTYSVTVNERSENRQIYCVITDVHGESLTTDTVGIYVNKSFEIIVQPKDAFVDALGEKATVSVTAQGTGLTYQWYYKNAGASKFFASTNTTETYSVTVNERVVNRQVYCVIKDKNGDTLTTDTVGIYVNESFEILEQPENVTVAALGEKATVSVTASGTGLTYQWYYKNAGASKFLASTNTTATYSVTVNERVVNRQVYCVIKDAQGDTLTTDTVTISVEE